MAIPGKRFNLNLDSDNWDFETHDDDDNHEAASSVEAVKDIRERNLDSVPAAPTLKSTRTGFPEHRQRKPVSVFKQKQQSEKARSSQAKPPEPSDQAILHRVAQNHGVDLATAQDKQNIDVENADRIANMTTEDIEQAREELMAQFNPEILQRFMARARIDDAHEDQTKQFNDHEAQRGPSLTPNGQQKKIVSFAAAETDQKTEKEDHHVEEDELLSESDDGAHPAAQLASSEPALSSSNVHFPTPPRNKADFVRLDPDSDTFLSDLREHYFPDLPHDPASLSWLQPPSTEENAAYDPSNTGFLPSSLRFNFSGLLLTPSQSQQIPVTSGLHHHGDAPSAAGYTIPELGLLSRSTVPGQRSIAYQVLGRVLFRLGRGDYGPRGGELQEALWSTIEKDRVLETVMEEANREGKGVHKSAQSYAIEALWLWRRGGGGDRGVLKEGERRAT